MAAAAASRASSMAINGWQRVWHGASAANGHMAAMAAAYENGENNINKQQQRGENNGMAKSDQYQRNGVIISK